MSFRFDPLARSLIVPVRVVGPRQNHTLNCAIDTGSTHTVLPGFFLRALGYDLARPIGHALVRAATGTARVPLVRVSAVTALDRVSTDLLVAAHELTLGTTADGLLGLDFFRGLVLKIDFARGRIRLDPPKRWWQFWR